ncbi:GNAT family N-acetyltransferase [Caulobacter sp. 17J65-9]|uniref:GNAT family N-acetyltransferase n=1 Tax=Caulobacter sp. 17J65-9 TaxID=2709382 RepID=UPI0013CD11E6|nr:GNAT family N-acetyltransferase [Caulobacter sp. 17J65-9]NEX91351.1 N-acetyltransferase [Caulobacter sp. 17J65-9]
MSASVPTSVRVHGRIAEIGREAWDACAAPSGNPFVSFDFLDACEQAGCAVEAAGWGPRHLAVEDDAGAVAGVMPLYLKGHSQGEYVFDHAWAQAYEDAGGRYYPKLLSAVPFTPVTGPRLLARPGADAEAVREALLGGALQVCRQSRASSLHVTFPTEADWKRLGGHGLLLRQDVQYWWDNPGYGSFDDFLAALSSGRRKTIRRERREALAGLEIETLTGAELTEAHWDAFFDFYEDTGARKWGQPYLNRRFFSLIGERMADRVVLFLARRGGEPIAGALNFVGGDTLYGRYWGATEPVPFLHFELSYYQAIEYAIARGLKRVEAGAQGEHKLARGYLPRPVYSAHYIADPALRAPVARYLDRERPAVAAEMAALEEECSPFRKG